MVSSLDWPRTSSANSTGRSGQTRQGTRDGKCFQTGERRAIHPIGAAEMPTTVLSLARPMGHFRHATDHTPRATGCDKAKYLPDAVDAAAMRNVMAKEPIVHVVGNTDQPQGSFRTTIGKSGRSLSNARAAFEWRASAARTLAAAPGSPHHHQQQNSENGIATNSAGHHSKVTSSRSTSRVADWSPEQPQRPRSRVARSVSAQKTE